MGLKDAVLRSFEKCGKGKKYLLAASGGIDSTVLLVLMHEFKLNFAVAHANFELRGDESTLDEEFIRNLSQKNSIPFFSEKFDIQSFKLKNNASTQSAARELRYAWFEEIKSVFPYDFLVTAHHLNDSVETFLINLMRGTGIQGLTGIGNRERILRPFKAITKNEIVNYAAENDIAWREDLSNQQDEYVRNQIRHHVIPAIEEIKPDFVNSMLKTLHFLRNDSEIIEKFIEELRSQLFIQQNDHIKIAVRDLLEISNPNIIYYLFHPYGFSVPKEINKLLKSNESAEIHSAEYRLIKNREYLLLKANNTVEYQKFIIKDLAPIYEPVHLEFKKIYENVKVDEGTFDFHKIKFPLSLRLRQPGDVFYPLGMHGKSKKVSKFYKDLKLSKLEKENTWLLCDALDRIIWIVGLRKDERFIANNGTTTWLQIEKQD